MEYFSQEQAIERSTMIMARKKYGGNEICADPVSTQVTCALWRVPLLLLSEVSCFLLFFLAKQAKS